VWIIGSESVIETKIVLPKAQHIGYLCHSHNKFTYMSVAGRTQPQSASSFPEYSSLVRKNVSPLNLATKTFHINTFQNLQVAEVDMGVLYKNTGQFPAAQFGCL
jgi:hypothetical protein